MEADPTPAISAAPSGLTTAKREHPLRAVGSKFCAPVPWMLGAAVVLEILLHKNIEAGAIAGLLVFNAALSFVQERHARNVR